MEPSELGSKGEPRVTRGMHHQDKKFRQSRRFSREPPGVDGTMGLGEGRYRLETRDKILIVDMPLLDAQTLQVTRRAQNE